MNVLRQWMNMATPVQQKRLAELAGTSRLYLYQLAAEHRSAGAALAGRIEAAADDIRDESLGKMPRIPRESLCPACLVCPYRAAASNSKPA